MKTWNIGGKQHAISARALTGPGNERRFSVDIDGRHLEVEAVPMVDGRVELRMPDGRRVLASAVASGAEVWVSALGRNTLAREVTRAGAGGHDAQGSLEAPMPGKVVAVKVKVGDVVDKGATLLVVEAMKMEHALKAPRAGVVEAIAAAAGDLVSPGKALVTLGDIAE